MISFRFLACFSLGLVITTAYDSMPADAVNHIIKQTGAKAIFTEVSEGRMMSVNHSQTHTHTHVDLFVWYFKQSLYQIRQKGST